MSDTRRIDEIVVGERHRRNLGDIAGLLRDIGEANDALVGQLRGLAARKNRARCKCGASGGADLDQQTSS